MFLPRASESFTFILHLPVAARGPLPSRPLPAHQKQMAPNSPPPKMDPSKTAVAPIIADSAILVSHQWLTRVDIAAEAVSVAPAEAPLPV